MSATRKLKRPRETAGARDSRVREVLAALRLDHPKPETALHYETPYQLLIAVMLSAQCTDERVNKVTPALFAAAPTPQAMVDLGLAKIRAAIRSINFFNNKSENVLKASKILLREHGGEVPGDLDKLVALPGVGRKTANVVLNDAFGGGGIVVDTHVTRVANRLGLVRATDAVKIEKELEGIIPRDQWRFVAHLFILHGRATCKALKPDCGRCSIAELCPSKGLPADAWKP
jgi:endonuclease-3